MNQGKVPATEVVEGLMLLVCGALLLTPGFFTDTIGFLCLIPNIRMRVANILLNKFIQSQQQHQQPGEQANVTIEGEFWEDENKRKRDEDLLP